MATNISDKRVVRIKLTNAELATVLGSKAVDVGLIDFTPEYVELINNGDGWEAIFEIATPVTP